MSVDGKIDEGGLLKNVLKVLKARKGKGYEEVDQESMTRVRSDLENGEVKPHFIEDLNDEKV